MVDLRVVNNPWLADLSVEQEMCAREGLKWAKRFGLLKSEMPDLRSALVLSLIVEAAKREVGDD